MRRPRTNLIHALTIRVVTFKAIGILQCLVHRDGGQDIRSRGAGAGSRGAIDDCCEQGLGRCSLDVPAVNTRYLNRHADSKGVIRRRD